MSKTVVYEGSTSRADRSDAYNVRDESGKMHRLVKDQPTEVPDDLASSLLGDDAPKGHKFSAGEEEDAKPSARRSGGGSGGSGQTSGGGTTSAAART